MSFKSFTTTTSIRICKGRFLTHSEHYLEKRRLILYIYEISRCKNNGNNDNIEKFFNRKLRVRKLYGALPVVI